MEIIDRINYLMKLNNLTPSAFADKIEVQRSSMSHLLSGRNKPSLDFIQKVVNAFPKVSADWLLYGEKKVNEPVSEDINKTNEKTTTSPTPQTTQPGSKKIKKIVVFYEDNTFEEFNSQSI